MGVKGEALFNVSRVSVWGDEKVLEMNSGDGRIQQQHCECI